MSEKKLQVRFPSSIEEENDMMMESVLQLATIAWAKLSRKLLTRREKNVSSST